jgi:hypothetical protein
MAKPDRPIDTSLAVAISLVTRTLKSALHGNGYRWRKEARKSVWWITSYTGLSTRLSYHAAIGWLVVSESPYDGPAIHSLVQSLWRTHADRITTRETRCR